MMAAFSQLSSVLGAEVLADYESSVIATRTEPRCHGNEVV
jgi:hypothetical protein